MEILTPGLIQENVKKKTLLSEIQLILIGKQILNYF